MKSLEVKVLLLCILVFITLVIYATIRVVAEQVTQPVATTPILPEENRTVISINGKDFSLDIASTVEEQEKGLSGRESLCKLCGMLFAFDKPGLYAIWMKDMNFPIDVLWLDETDTVIHLVENMSPESYPTSFYPKSPAKYIIELPAGTIAETGIELSKYININL